MRVVEPLTFQVVCPTCRVYGAWGFVPLGQFPTVPGGQTECRKRCRCVIQVVTRGEVEDGTAILLSGFAPENEPL